MMMIMMKVLFSLVFFVVGFSSASDEVVVLTKSNFDKIVDGSKSVIVKFYAPWCGHCQKLAPVWEDLGKAFAEEDEVVVAKVDATLENDLAKQFDVKGYPTLMVFGKGQKKPTLYQQGRTLKHFVAYINMIAGTTRKPDGTIDLSFGTLTPVSEALKAVSCEGQSKSECIKRLTAAVEETIEEMHSKEDFVENTFLEKCEKYYGTALAKLQKDGNFFSTELKRLEQLAGNANIGNEAKLFVIARRNILAELQRTVKDKVTKAVSDEL